MSDYKYRRRFRFVLIVILIILGLSTTIGPILYIMLTKPVTTKGPVIGPRTY